MISNKWLFSLILSFSLVTQAEELLLKCQKNFKPQETYLLPQSLCDSRGSLRVLKMLFPSKPDQAAEIWKLDASEKLQSYQTFNIEGEEIQRIIYDVISDGTYVTYQNGRPSARFDIQIFPQFHSEKLEAWFYKNGRLHFHENYQSTTLEGYPRILSIYDDQEKLQWVYDLKFRVNQRSVIIVTKFDLYNKDKGKIGSYDEFATYKLGSQPNRIPGVVIDTGFDVNHPEIRPYLSSRFTGEYHDPAVDRTSSPFLQDSIILSASRQPPFPFSHGTHVASIAFKGISQFELVGFAGDYSEPDFLERISKFIKTHKVPFVNMSFGFGEKTNPFGANESARFALLQLMNENPETLFIIAAGNSPRTVERDQDSDWPAGAPVSNKIVVAATSDSYYDARKLTKARLTSFSSYGMEVDVAAPGENVLGANIGGSRVEVSGTSMAAPFVMNLAMKLKEANPFLTPLQIRDIIIQTVTVPEVPLNIKSRGVVNVEKALALARSIPPVKNVLRPLSKR